MSQDCSLQNNTAGVLPIDILAQMPTETENTEANSDDTVAESSDTTINNIDGKADSEQLPDGSPCESVDNDSNDDTITQLNKVIQDYEDEVSTRLRSKSMTTDDVIKTATTMYDELHDENYLDATVRFNLEKIKRSLLLECLKKTVKAVDYKNFKLKIKGRGSSKGSISEANTYRSIPNIAAYLRYSYTIILNLYRHSVKIFGKDHEDPIRAYYETTEMTIEDKEFDLDDLKALDKPVHLQHLSVLAGSPITFATAQNLIKQCTKTKDPEEIWKVIQQEKDNGLSIEDACKNAIFLLNEKLGAGVAEQAKQSGGEADDTDDGPGEGSGLDGDDCGKPCASEGADPAEVIGGIPLGKLLILANARVETDLAQGIAPGSVDETIVLTLDETLTELYCRLTKK